MKIKLDENLPYCLFDWLSERGYEVDTVLQEGLEGLQDSEVWDAARKGGKFFITQDLDFSDARKFAPGTHPGLLLLRLRDPGRVALAQRAMAIFQTYNIESWQGCFVVVSDRKIRVRRPA